MASTFTYQNYYYTQSATEVGKYNVTVMADFTHKSPTDGDYQYAIRYWYYNTSQGESSSSPHDTATLISEMTSSSKHSSDRTHHLEFTLMDIIPGDNYAVNAQIIYSVDEGHQWLGSSLWMGKRVITLSPYQGKYNLFFSAVQMYSSSQSRYGVLYSQNITTEDDHDYSLKTQIKVNRPNQYWTLTAIGNQNSVSVYPDGLSYRSRVLLRCYVLTNQDTGRSTSFPGYYQTGQYFEREIYINTLENMWDVVGDGDLGRVIVTPSENAVNIKWSYTPDYSNWGQCRSFITFGTGMASLDNVGTAYADSPTEEGLAYGRIDFSLNYSNLSPGTYYNFKIYIECQDFDDIGDGDDTYFQIPVTYTGHFITEQAQTVSLLKWSWSSAAGSWNATVVGQGEHATTQQTSAAYNAVSGTPRGKTTDFHHRVWNDLIDWMAYCTNQLSGSSNIPSGVKMNPNDRTLTAVRWNSMVSIFNTLNTALQSGYSMQTRTSGEQVKGNYLTDIPSYLNSAIDLYEARNE